MVDQAGHTNWQLEDQEQGYTCGNVSPTSCIMQIRLFNLTAIALRKDRQPPPVAMVRLQYLYLEASSLAMGVLCDFSSRNFISN